MSPATCKVAASKEYLGCHFCCCISCATCCSAALDSSAKRSPTLPECFMNFSQHFETHCRHEKAEVRDSSAYRATLSNFLSYCAAVVRSQKF